MQLPYEGAVQKALPWGDASPSIGSRSIFLAVFVGLAVGFAFADGLLADFLAPAFALFALD